MCTPSGTGRRALSRLSCWILSLPILTAPASADVVYVNIAHDGGANDGTSWANAFTGNDSLVRALAAADKGDEIWVATGVYTTATDDPAVSFVLRDAVQLYAGFVGNETSREERDPRGNATTLSGDLLSYHVVVGNSLGASTVLDGFAIALGRAERFSGGTDASHGAGLFLTDSLPTIRQCVFIQNFTLAGDGAGAFLRASSPTFEDCSWFNNRAEGNSRGGAAVYMESGSAPLFLRCTLTGNIARRFGGACYVTGGSSPRFFNSHINFNTAAAVSRASGAALYLRDASNAVLRNCTVAHNFSSSGDGSIGGIDGPADVFNSIIYFNRGSYSGRNIQLSEPGTVAYSCVEFGADGAGNISSLPHFIDPEAGDFHLMPTSPCIDAADNCAAVPGGPHDAEQNNRFLDAPTVPDTGLGTRPIVDMGAFEYVPPTTPCPADWNLSGDVTSQDFFDFLAAFFAESADFNHNCVTDSQDFFDFLTAFLQGC